MAFPSLPSIEIVFSKPKNFSSSTQEISSEGKNNGAGKFITSCGKTVQVCKKTGAVICSTTGKVIKKTALVWPIKAILSILDLISTPFANMAGKDLNFSKLWKVGSGIIILSFWLYYIMDSAAARFFVDIGVGVAGANKLAILAKLACPGALAFMGLSMILGGMRLQMGRTFLQKYGMGLEPLPAFESGVIFKIGDVKLSLRDMHTGIGAFGGVGSGKVNWCNSLVINELHQKTRVAEVKVGDKIKGPNGFETVLKIIPYKDHDFWTLETKSGKKTHIGMSHLWWFKIMGKGGEALGETKILKGLQTEGETILIPVLEKEALAWEELKSINFFTKGEGACFVLSGTDHLYIVDDSIVTHNCLDPDQDLLMFDGSIKKVKDVVPGDLLMGPDSKARRIMVTSTGYGPLYRITPIKGSGKPWICNDAHVMTLRYTNQGGSRPARTTPKGLEIKDYQDRRKHYKGISQVFGTVPNKKVGRYYQKVLEDNNFIMDAALKDLIKRKSPSRRLDFFWKMFRPEGIEFPNMEEHDPSRFKYTHVALNTEEFYLAGAWIGDGGIDSLTWYNQDKEILNTIANYATKHKLVVAEYLPPKKDPNFRKISIRRPDSIVTNLEKWLIEFTNATSIHKTGCAGRLSGLYKKNKGEYDKNIPHWALTAPREKRLALLAGIIDTDGSLHVEGRCFDLIQKRKHIIEKVVWLCRSLGFAAADPFEAWKECTNKTQNLPSVEDLIQHPILLQELIDRAHLKISLQLKEGKLDINSSENLRQTLNTIQSPNKVEKPLNGYLQYNETIKASSYYFERANNLIESIKNLYKASVGKTPRKEVILKYIANKEELEVLVEKTVNSEELKDNIMLVQLYLNESEWGKLHIDVQVKHLLEGPDAIPLNLDALRWLLQFHESEPRERYWRTTISGDIEKIPTRVKHKQLSSNRPAKVQDGRELEDIDDRNYKDPLCFGWDAEPIGDGPYCGFTLDGDGRFLLGDFTVTHNTVALMVPMMRQFFRQLRDEDDNSEFAKCGALILDEKGDFIDSTITEMMLANRSLQDLVIIDPDLDLYRYNPLDPNQSADENAAKLAKVQKILGTSSGGDNAYWDQTSQMTIKYFLQLLEVYKPKHKIGLDDIARFMRDDELAGVLCDTVEKVIEEKKRNNEISEEAYGMYTDAISSTRNAWIQLNPNTKSTLKTTITNMLGPIASNPRLQKVFCRDTNFSFRDLPNRGKIVLFRGSGIDKSTARLICVCLKIDFQTWQKRRNGSAASAYGLNTMRTVVFICDEYQEFVTCGGEGDETFYGVSRSTRTAPIVATQSYNSLETAIKNKEQTKTLRQNIATWVFFRSTDQDTCELGKFLAGQSKKEDFSTSQDTTGFLETASNLGGGGGNKGSSISISRKLEENFRTDDFSRLVTMTMEKSKTGPWYSEAIVYHYHDIDDAAESRCYKTKLTHLYYDNKLRKESALNVKHLDFILYDRNWQRKAMQRGLLMVQRASTATETEKKREQSQKNARAQIDQATNKVEDSEHESNKLRRIKGLVASKKREIDEDLRDSQLGAVGSIDMDEDLTTEELNERIQNLKEKRQAAGDEAEIASIEIQLNSTRQILTRFVLKSASGEPDTRKEILKSSGLPYDLDQDEIEDQHDEDSEDSEDDDDDNEIEDVEIDEDTIQTMAQRAIPRNDDDEDDEEDNVATRRSDQENYAYERDDNSQSTPDPMWNVEEFKPKEKPDTSVIDRIPNGVIDASGEVEDTDTDTESNTNSQSNKNIQIPVDQDTVGSIDEKTQDTYNQETNTTQGYESSDTSVDNFNEDNTSSEDSQGLFGEEFAEFRENIAPNTTSSPFENESFLGNLGYSEDVEQTSQKGGPSNLEDADTDIDIEVEDDSDNSNDSNDSNGSKQ